jgi:hypothetical protein
MSREPWDEWKDAWRDTSPVDVERLRRHVDGKRRRMRGFVIAEVLVSLIVLAHLAWRYVSLDGGSLWRGLILCGTGLVISSQVLMLALRRGTWRGNSAAPADLLRLTIRRAETGVRLIVAQWIGFGIVVAVFAAWTVWVRLSLDAAAQSRLAHAMEISALAQVPLVLAFGAWTAWYLPRLRRRRALAQRLLTDLDHS